MLEILKSPEFGQFVVNILLALVTVLVPLIGAAVRNLVAANKDDARFQTLMSVARVAVLAAEQAGLAGRVSDKKDAAIEYAEAMLADRGMKVDLDALSAAIESAVADELNRPVIGEMSYRRAQELPARESAE